MNSMSRDGKGRISRIKESCLTFLQSAVSIAASQMTGGYLQAAPPTGVIRVWDLDGTVPPKQFTDNTRQRFPLGFLPKAQRLLTVHPHEHELHLLDVATGKEERGWDISVLPDLRTFEFSPDEAQCG